MKKYTQEELDKLLYLINYRSIKEIALALGRTELSVKFKIRSLGLKAKVRGNIRLWTFNQKCVLKEKYASYRDDEIAILLGKTVGAIKGMANKLGLKKLCNPTQFKKGSNPHNKGIKQATSEKCYETTFKKGNVPPNSRSEGVMYERISSSESAIYYKPEGSKRVVRYAYYVWQQAYGELPKNHVIRHKDKDFRNCNLDNLYLMSRAELLKANLNREKSGASLTKTNIVKRFNANAGKGKLKTVINMQL